jgi:putative SOS response-associated peptidase YedK
MCGRFLLSTPGPELARVFGLAVAPELRPRFNVAPGQPIALVHALPDAAGRALAAPLWGYAGPGAAPGRRPINARAETIASSPLFRSAFARRRGLVPADGFYEWQHAGRSSRPFAIRPRAAGPIAFAAIFDAAPDGEPASCAIVTTAANGQVRPIHDRMPVILPPEAWAEWLDPARVDAEALGALLAPARDDLLFAHPVDRRVNDVREDDAALALPERDLFSLGGAA